MKTRKNATTKGQSRKNEEVIIIPDNEIEIIEENIMLPILIKEDVTEENMLLPVVVHGKQHKVKDLTENANKIDCAIGAYDKFGSQ